MTQAEAVRTTAHWIGSPDGPLLGWLSGTGPEGVLVLPPVGYEWWSAHRTVRSAAEALAGRGLTVLRLDYAHTGDSSGQGPVSLAACRRSAEAGRAFLREIGCARVTILGIRLGGAIALDSRLDADAVVAWEPVEAGRRFARELRMHSETLPDGVDGAVVAGMHFGGAMLDELTSLSLQTLERAPAARVTLVGRDLNGLSERLTALGADVAADDPPGAELALEVPAEDASVPREIVASIVDAVDARNGSSRPPVEEQPRATFEWDGHRVDEEVLRLTDRELVGVLTTPAGAAPSTLVVWLNSGSEPHVGPGRAWVEYARSLAGLGYASLRLDFSGWGESPDHGHAPGRPYDAHCIEETAAAVHALRSRGYERVVLAGLCAGAWVALRAALEVPSTAVIALNPQLYWQPGDPVEALMRDTRRRRTAERERLKRGRRLGLWSALDLLGHRGWAARWLDELARRDVPVALVFAEGDDGLEYLQDRLSRRLGRVTARGSIRIVEVPGIDHSMHRAWLRGRIVAVVKEILESLP